jgi:hypothetical protein
VYTLVQPTTIPGSFNITTQPFPALQEIINKPAPALPVYGVYTGVSELTMNLARIKSVGWKSLRVTGFSDVSMLFAARNNLEAMPVLTGTRRDDCASDQAFLSAYTTLVRDQVSKYGPGGSFFTSHPTEPANPAKHWELWNEPNFQYMWNAGTSAQREALYAQALMAAYDTLKKYSPTSTAVGFGTGGSSAGDLGFIQHVHQQSTEVKNSYDVLSTHPYVTPCPPEADKVEGWGSYSVARSVASIRSTLAANSKSNCPIWYTECGWEISQADGGTYSRAADITISQRLQAAYVCRMYALAMRLGVERVHIMYIIDADGFNGGFFGGTGSTWRESAFAVQCLIRVLPNPKILGAISDGTNGYYAYYYQPDANAVTSDSVIMAWNVAGPANVNLPVRSGQAYYLIDMLSDTTRIIASSAQLAVEVGPCPVYLVKAVASPVRDRGASGAVTDGYSDCRIQPNPFTRSFVIGGHRGPARQAVLYDRNGRVVRKCMVSGATTECAVPESREHVFFLKIDGVEGCQRLVRVE